MSFSIGFQRSCPVSIETLAYETQFLWVVYIRYADGADCAHTGRAVMTHLPSAFANAGDPGASDCVWMVPTS